MAGFGLAGAAFSPPGAGVGFGLLERAVRAASCASGSSPSALLHAATSTGTVAGLSGSAGGSVLCSALAPTAPSCEAVAAISSSSSATTPAGGAQRHYGSTSTRTSGPLMSSLSAELTTARVSTPPRPTTGTGYRTGSLQLAVVAKKGGRRRRRRPSPGRGGGGDDYWGGDGGGGGDGNNGGGADWGGEESDGSRELDHLVLWNLLCFFSLVQSLHFGVCQVLSGTGPDVVANNLVLTTALFGSGRKAAVVS